MVPFYSAMFFCVLRPMQSLLHSRLIREKYATLRLYTERNCYSVYQPGIFIERKAHGNLYICGHDVTGKKFCPDCGSLLQAPQAEAAPQPAHAVMEL